MSIDFTKISAFLYEDDGRVGPVMVIKDDGPNKGEPLFIMNKHRLDIAKEIAKRFNEHLNLSVSSK